MMFRSILCAVDFSEQSRHALRWADRLCGSDGRLIVVSVVDPLLSGAARTRFGILDRVVSNHAAIVPFHALPDPNSAIAGATNDVGRNDDAKIVVA